MARAEDFTRRNASQPVYAAECLPEHAPKKVRFYFLGGGRMTLKSEEFAKVPQVRWGNKDGLEIVQENRP